MHFDGAWIMAIQQTDDILLPVMERQHTFWHALPKPRPNTSCTRSPTKNVGAMVVGVCAFLGTFRGLKLVPSKWRFLVPPTSGYPYRLLRKRKPLGIIDSLIGNETWV